MPTSDRSSSIDPAGLTFVDGADGRHEADLSLLALAIGSTTAQSVGAGSSRRCRCGSTTTPTRSLRQRGLRYSARVSMKTAGGYQIRAAVQDDRSKALGTAAQFVEVPKRRQGSASRCRASMLAETDAPAATADHDLRAGPHGRVTGAPSTTAARRGDRALVHARDRAARRQGRPHDPAGADRRRAEGRAGGRPGGDSAAPSHLGHALPAGAYTPAGSRSRRTAARPCPRSNGWTSRCVDANRCKDWNRGHRARAGHLPARPRRDRAPRRPGAGGASARRPADLPDRDPPRDVRRGGHRCARAVTSRT